MMMRTLTQGLPRGDLVYVVEMDYPCLRLDRLFNGLMDQDTFDMEPWHDTDNWEYIVTLDGLFAIKWTMILRWIIDDGMDTLMGPISLHG